MSYFYSSTGVSVNLMTHAASGGDAEGDSIVNIENVCGSDTGNDYLVGDNGANQIWSGGGSDTLIGNGGGDTFFSGDGDDWIDGGAGRDAVSYFHSSTGVYVNLMNPNVSNGDAQGDIIMNIEDVAGSNTGGDNIAGDNGANHIWGGGGNDTLTGNGGDDVLDGGIADDSLLGGAGNDLLLGGDGDDYLNGGAGDDFIDGGAGVDTASYRWSAGGVTVNLGVTSAQNTGGAGVDTITNLENLIGSAYSDILIGDSRANALYGGDGDDDLIGGAGDDVLDGGNGRDIATYVFATGGVTVNLANTGAQNTGGAGVDTLVNIEDVEGSLFNDVLTGDNGNNVLSAFNGADYLYGGGGNDTLYGGDGDDYLNGGAGNDVMDGGNGVDVVSYERSTAGVNVNLGNVIGQATGGDGNDILLNFENVTGSSYNDVLTGNDGANVLNGGDGDDRLIGGAGADVLFGGAGNDILDGGSGRDSLAGGAGADAFVFSSPLAAGQYDAITDFAPSADNIRLSQAIFSGLGAAGSTLSSANFVNGPAATGSRAQIIYNSGTGALLYDADGARAGAAVQFAQVGVGLNITASNFQII